MRWCFQDVTVFALVALPAASSFCFLPSSRLCVSTTPFRMIPGTASIRAKPEAPCVSKEMLLKMQSSPGDGRSGEGRQVPGGEGYSSGPGEARPPWIPPSASWDEFDEGVPRLNTVFLTGYLGQDPKPKYFDSGKVVLNLSLAVKREYHPLERKAFGVAYGEEETDWFQLEMWNRDAEFAAQVCKKGGRIGVTGSLSLNAWTDREGKPRTTIKILVQNLEILDSRAEQASRSDNRDDNLWESERLERADAAAKFKAEGATKGIGGAIGSNSGGGGGGGGGSGTYQSPEDLAAKARKKEAEDAWWSAEPASPTTGAEGGGGAEGGSGGERGGQKEASWWDEDGGGGGGSKGIEPDSLPSFFDS